MNQSTDALRCAECEEPIAGQPIWFDPFAQRVRTDQQSLELQGTASAAPSSPAALPFHSECLERRLGDV
jgi:hypothetical protein